MVFSSTVFLFIFLPVVWIAHMLIPPKMLWLRNALLAVASLVFYAYGEPVYIVVMIASVTVNYFAALIISKLSGKARSAVCALAVIIDIASLCFFKYVPWLVRVIDSAAGLSIPVPDFTIPVGISFYTFQILSYVVDVNSGKTEVQKSFGALFLYISFFPQLIAGPIVKYGDICAQLSSREVTVERTSLGIRRFIFGLSKKVLVSNTAAILAKAAFEASSPSSLMAWSGAVAYCIQLYFDFSGYSDMAIGLASMFGFDLPQNFNYPYFAVTIRDFWKRWHISLTSWFREYVYFPLGGNRKGKARTVINRLIVFFLTGLWHGANFTFILWGMWHGLLMMFEQLAGFDRLAKKRALRLPFRIYTLLAVTLGFVVFNSKSIGAAFLYIARMFSFSGSPADALIHFSPFMCLMLICGLVFSFPITPRLTGLSKRVPALEALSYIVCLPLLLACIMSLAAGSFNPFIYYIF
ncbi:MAG: MBOAT family O-acyltransferase [Candidatus Flemingibacterium sp.]|nr:MBOAT family O-acyltransferase [Candidatus Flemingibacterium sp.]